jgi:hypothetical protein
MWVGDHGRNPLNGAEGVEEILAFLAPFGGISAKGSE